MSQTILHAAFNSSFEISYKNEKALYQMPPHTHNAIEIYLNLSDIPHAVIGTYALPLQKNTLLVIPSYCVHQLYPTRDIAYERYVLTINTSWLDAALGTSDIESCKYLKSSDSPLIIPISTKQLNQLSQVFDQLQNDNERGMFVRLSHFFETMELINQIAVPHSRQASDYINKHVYGTARTVSEMIDYIHVHLFEKIRIQDIADYFYLNPDYVSRIFRKYTNTTIGNYITIQRMSHARQLLREGNTISQVQQKTGYESYEHFFRTFKKTVGCTPKEYRETFRR